MTKIEMLYENNVYVGFRMEGHAGYNKKGPDILCASLSAISQMTVNGIADWIGVDVDELITEQSLSKGILKFEIPYFLTSITTQQMFKSFEMYIEQLLEDYSNWITLERR